MVFGDTIPVVLYICYDNLSPSAHYHVSPAVATALVKAELLKSQVEWDTLLWDPQNRFKWKVTS